MSFQAEYHAIYVNQHGNLKRPGLEKIKNIEFTEEHSAGAEDLYVDAIISNYRSQNLIYKSLSPSASELRFTIFIHGGLNTFNNVWQRANIFSEAMLADGYYPLFVGWNSAPFTNYFDHLFHIRKGERRPILAWLTTPFVFLEDVVRSIARLPTAWLMTVNDPLTVMKSVYSAKERDFDRRIVRLVARGFNLISEPPYVGVGPSFATILNPLKLATAPVVDGLGAGSWNSMLRRTDLVLSKALAFEGNIKVDESDNFADTALTKLLKKLERGLIKHQYGLQDSLCIDLIAHSMGAIVANNVLARHPRLPIKNVVFMGAAARIKDIENGVVPWLLRDDNGAEFYNLSLDPYREISETNFLDSLPRGSLLHWIDNIFGEVNSFKDRVAGGWWNIIRTAEDVFPESVRSRVYLTRFPIGGADKGPQRHGEFDDYPFWKRSFWIADGEQQPFQVQSAPKDR